MQALSAHPLIDILQPLIVKVAEEAHVEERDNGVGPNFDVLLIFLAEDLHAHHNKGKDEEEQNHYEDGEVRDGAGNGGTTPLEVAVDQGHVDCCAELLARRRTTVVQKLHGTAWVERDLKDVCSEYADVIQQALALLDERDA